MKKSYLIAASILWIFLSITKTNAAIFLVSSQEEFNAAHDTATMNDSIVWETGTYSNIFMSINNDNLFITVEELGGAIFNGTSRVDISSDYVTLEGVQFLDGNIGTRDVINTSGSYNIFNQININSYRSYKYLRIREESQYCEVKYCNFENRLNLDDQNILSILVDNDNPGYHKVQHCSFKNFAGTGNDLGIEPIRIGVSSQADFISRSLVEYCYFTECDGDGELISSKARQNVYRFNTFENNSKAELVLRHGSENIVYGNFFLNGKGGVRVREGQDQYIYNNYFFNLNDRPIYLQNEDSDPLDNINIAFNTIIECAEVRLGGIGNDKPTNVTFANNIFTDPDDQLFRDATNTETWIGNISFGDFGITFPSDGMTTIDPQLVENAEGFFGLDETSPAINAAVSGYAALPQYEGIDDIDSEVLFDLMQQSRPSLITERDLGCNEFPHNTPIQPIATEENTGPSYDTSFTTSTENDFLQESNFIKVLPNPASSEIFITVETEKSATIRIDIFNFQGQKIKSISRESNFSGAQIINQELEDFSSGAYTIHALGLDREGREKQRQVVKFIKQ